MNRLAIILLSMLCIGCTVDENYQLKYKGDKLVLNGVLNPQQVIQINLSRSNPPTGEVDSLLSVTGAKVELYYNGDQETLVETTPGIYISSTKRKPTKGDTYSLTASLDGYPEISTPKIEVPDLFPLKDFSFRETESTNYNPFPGYQLSLVIDDDELTKDYYELVVEGFHPSIGNKKLSPRVDGEIGDVKLPCEHGRLNNILYDDACFNGQSFHIKLEVPHTESRWTGNDTEIIKYEYILLKMRKVSPSYFQYKESSAIPEGIDYAFFEPKFLYNNVEGGFGTWSAVNETIIRIPR